MSSQHMVPFEAPQLPAHIAALSGVSEDDLISGTGGGFPVISIKGKVFTIVRGEEKVLVKRPGEDEPAGSIEVVILRANPALSKTYYPDGYVEGTADKPTCYSDDGIAPAKDAAEPQSQKCAICAHNQWGSKISENGSKVKACSDVRRLAVAPVGQLNDPMLLRVPAASLAPLGQYGDQLKKRGVKYPSVSTKVSFDFSVAYPALTFKPVAFLSEEMAAQVVDVMKSDIVTRIVGMSGINAAVQVVAQPAEQTRQTASVATPVSPALAAPKPQPAVAVPKPKAEAKPAVKKGNGPTSPFESSSVVEKTLAAPKLGPQTQPVSRLVEVKTDDLEADLSKVLADAGFDDVTA